MRSGEALEVQWLTSKVTVEKHGRTNAGGIQRHALRLASIAASTELQASQNSKKIPILKISSFDVFVIHSVPDPVSIFSFHSGSVQRATAHMAALVLSFESSRIVAGREPFEKLRKQDEQPSKSGKARYPIPWLSNV
ncbi:hypothetical protein ALC60_10255 [Trachymyrmex zeteki]|uniref:Uncharacterized protein n=1 Tax=Mycetomoellerius zeteki TaxID=64791 RepID=A0A151WRX3_9HYME|nr:hypothetical protein ALC60_10255 [Trachymyrmex zeteki]